MSEELIMSPETATAEAASISTPYRKQKRYVLVGLLVLAAIIGGAGIFLPDDPKIERAIEFAFGIPLLLLILSWCVVDARERQYPMSMTMKVCLVLVFAVAFPLYLFRSRGFGGFKALCYVGLCGAAMLATAYISGALCYGVGYLLGVVE